MQTLKDQLHNNALYKPSSVLDSDTSSDNSDSDSSDDESNRQRNWRNGYRSPANKSDISKKDINVDLKSQEEKQKKAKKMRKKLNKQLDEIKVCSFSNQHMKRLSMFLTEEDDKLYGIKLKHEQEKQEKAARKRNRIANQGQQTISEDTLKSDGKSKYSHVAGPGGDIQSPHNNNMSQGVKEEDDESENEKYSQSSMTMSEQEHYDGEEFQKVLINKTKQIVEVITQMRDTINTNAEAQYLQTKLLKKQSVDKNLLGKTLQQLANQILNVDKDGKPLETSPLKFELNTPTLQKVESIGITQSPSEQVSNQNLLSSLKNQLASNCAEGSHRALRKAVHNFSSAMNIEIVQKLSQLDDSTNSLKLDRQNASSNMAAEKDKITKEVVKMREAQKELQYDVNRDVQKCKDYVDKKIVEKYKSTDNTLEIIRKQCEEKIQEIQNQAQTMTCGMISRVEDCESLVQSRVTEEYVENFGRNISTRFQEILDRKMNEQSDKLHELDKSLTKKQTKIDLQNQEQFNIVEENFEDVRKTLNMKLDKKAMDKINGNISELREYTDRKFAEHKNYVSLIEDKLEMLQRLVQRLQIDLKDREQALAKVPHDVAGQLDKLTRQCQADHSEMKYLREKFDSKLDRSQYQTGMRQKLDKVVFWEIFPQGISPQATLNEMIRGEVDKVIEKVQHQMKLWDQKLYNLRAEINIGQVYRRLNMMAQDKHLKDATSTLEVYIKEVEARILDNSERDSKTVAELEELKRRFLLIFDRQQEVNIGKRNVNCLSCSEQPNNAQFHGNDGKQYKGKLVDASGRKINQNEESNPELLQMRWDHLGLEKAYQRLEQTHMQKEAQRQAHMSETGKDMDHLMQDRQQPSSLPFLQPNMPYLYETSGELHSIQENIVNRHSSLKNQRGKVKSAAGPTRRAGTATRFKQTPQMIKSTGSNQTTPWEGNTTLTTQKPFSSINNTMTTKSNNIHQRANGVVGQQQDYNRCNSQAHTVYTNARSSHGEPEDQMRATLEPQGSEVTGVHSIEKQFSFKSAAAANAASATPVNGQMIAEEAEIQSSPEQHNLTGSKQYQDENIDIQQQPIYSHHQINVTNETHQGMRNSYAERTNETLLNEAKVVSTEQSPQSKSKAKSYGE